MTTAALSRPDLFGFFEAIAPILDWLTENPEVTLTDDFILGPTEHENWTLMSFGLWEDDTALFLRSNGTWVRSVPTFHNRFASNCAISDEDLLERFGLNELINLAIARIARFIVAVPEHLEDYSKAIAALEKVRTSNGS